MKKSSFPMKVIILCAWTAFGMCCDEGPADDDVEEVCCTCQCWGHQESCIQTETVKLAAYKDCKKACEAELCKSPCWASDFLEENCE